MKRTINEWLYLAACCEAGWLAAETTGQWAAGAALAGVLILHGAEVLIKCE